MRLIDADVFKENLDKEFETATDAHDAVDFALEDTPTIEAKPVKHGKWVVTDCDTMMMYEIADEIDDAPSADVAPVQWIRARERKPEDSDEMVLAIVYGKPRRDIVLEGAYCLACYSRKEGWILEEYPEWEGACVTHWMPLPEAPEKEEE